ncbi:E3 SUMO-protein ligase RanBP2 [Epargyreus clarus]|uniref:E3 SUMO-protein ligase RanBP2 n=1 Tax=Epargyreus clarus TaxID=520877 RepID=UPI003C2E3BBD
MYRNKKDVDKHVQNLTSKLPLKEFQTRAYSIARLYFEVGDYTSCQKYVEQYLTQKDNNAAAHKLLGLALQKMGQKEKALEHYNLSLDIDPTQTSTILDICEILADDEVEIDPGRAKYWCEKAEATFPRHPITFKLRERLLTTTNPDSETLVKFLKAELAVRPKDAILHTRLLKHYLLSNQIREAFDHSCNIEFDEQIFLNNYTWYDTLSEILKHNSLNTNDWLYQLLLLTVKERICVLSLTEVPNGSSKSLVESNDLLCAYDQALESVAKVGAPPGFGEFHSSLVQHHRGQLAFHTATYLLKKAKKNQLSWRDATKFAGPLMLIAWQIVPLDPKVNWLMHAPKKQQSAVHRWYIGGSYRCSQSGHYILSNMHENSQVFLDHISQFCAGAHWRDKIYEIVFPGRDQLAKNKLSHLMSNTFNAPALRLPRRHEVEAYDENAQREYPSSLHHFVWILNNYKNFAKFKCSLFDMLTSTSSNYGVESLNKLDVLAFLYCATLTTQNKSNQITIHNAGKPSVLPANIMDLMCSLAQMKWWDCAYKYSQKELGADLTGIHSTLSSGIEVIRCIDNHGLDPKLLCTLGGIFSEQAKQCTVLDVKNSLEIRARLYYSSAINLLEKVKSKVILKMPETRLFNYTYKDLDTKELNVLIEECKIYVATGHLNDGEYEKAIELLSSLRSPNACYHLSETYRKIAFDERKISKDVDSEMKYVTLLNKAKNYAYKSLEKLKETDISYKDSPLYLNIQELIEDIECCMNKVDPDISNSALNEYSSDENESFGVSEYISVRSNSNFYHKQNVSSTPKPPKKQVSNANMTTYRTAVDTQILENSAIDHQMLERIEKQIKVLQKKDTTINDFMEQTKEWFDENRKLGNQIISTINTNIQNTTEQFKLLKISVDQVKDQIEECKNECKDVGDLKKQIAELKKEVNKLKKTSSEQTIDESELYNLDDEYRANDNVTGCGIQLPFGPSHVMPQFPQRLVPPFPVATNPYQLYGQNFYNLYNQYSQFPQVSAVPGAPQIFDPTRSQANYPGVYPTPDQMYLDVSHLVGATMPTVPTVPAVPAVPTVPVPTVSSISVPVVTSAPTKVTAPKSKMVPNVEVKDTSRLPVNVVITSSDPLPVCTSAPAPVLSVTIPPKHIKGSPHNYQIPMPSANDAKPVTASPVFSFPSAANKATVAPAATTTVASFPSWNHSTIMNQSEISKTVVDGIFTGPSPNNSLNKSRTLSEKSNTSIENYDPCPDFKPIIPLPAEVKITTGEEDETIIFSSRAKLFRFSDKQWKERGLGEMKLLKHKITGKVRVLMRREQIHKICANHIISAEMEISPMKNETKAYFWVANDFAEETVILEKFCIRFKTADIAKQFYDVFENARLEASQNQSNKNDSSIMSNEETKAIKSSPNVTSTPNKSITTDTNKTVMGGFTFSSTPSFKPVSESNKSPQKTVETAPSKSNIFSGLTFNTGSSSPFVASSVFANLLNAPSNQNAKTEPVQKEPNKLNTSDVVEEFEPNVEFKPVIPLPALVNQKTGEEDETILFEHRAKLLRFDAAGKEWKERGLGNIKLLVHKDNVQKVRLLMRREQIMKVCCNHSVTKEMVFQKMPNMDKAVTWCAKDFSDGELIAETFCLRFKTVQACDNFVSAVKSAQSKIKEESKSIKEEQNAAKVTQSGFGDKFKPKPGSWHCEACYTNNLENFEHCACCEQPKPKGSSNVSKSTIPVSYSFGFGDKFKPKPGSWECKSCMVRNEAGKEICSACNIPKDSSTQIGDSKLASKNPPMMFGIPGQTQSTLATTKDSTAPVASGWGDQFKPKKGSWECNQCFVRNDEKVEVCSACNNPKNADTTTKTIKYNFGIVNANTNTKNQVTNLFETPSTQKFNFGIPANQTAIVVSFGEQKATTSVFAITKQPTTNDGPINFCLKRTDESKPAKPALLPTPQLNWTEIKNFDFMGIKPKDQISISTTDTVSNQKLNIANITKDHQKQGLEEKKQLERKDETGSDDVIFVNEIQATEEEKQKAKELMLPENFFTYKTKDPCQGCRGCKDEDGDLKTEQSAKPNKAQQKVAFGLSTPVRTLVSNVQSPTNSIYGTPNSFEKTADVSIFRTPLGATAASSNSSSHTSSTNSVDENDVTNKENTFTEKSTSDMNTFSAAKSSILMPPKFGLSNTSNDGKDEADSKPDPKNTETKSIFGNSTLGISVNKPIFGSSQNKIEIGGASSIKSIFGTNDQKPVTSIFGTDSQKPVKSIFDTDGQKPVKSIFGTDDQKPVKSIFGTDSQMPVKSIFGTDDQKPVKSIFGTDEQKRVKSIFGTDDQKPVNLFSSASQGSIFGPAAMKNFGFSGTAPNQNTTQTSVFDNLSNNTSNIFGAKANDTQQSVPSSITVEDSGSKKDVEIKPAEKKDAPFKLDNSLTFEALSTSGPGFNIEKKADFQWEGAGQQLFGGKNKDASNRSKNDSGAADESGAAADEEYDPHYEPIVPLPDKVIVTTGEEDEEKLFGERCKLYRYDESTREWKERGIGEMKLLYHPGRNTYRLLLRREQVHKAVLNMLLFKNLALLPMKNTDRAWTWAGQNFAEGAPEQETLAVRFKFMELATAFHDKVVECVEKLKLAPEETVKDETTETFTEVAPLRLPKHLETSARADEDMSAKVAQQVQAGITITPIEQLQSVSSDPAPDASLSQSQQHKEVSQGAARHIYFEQPEKKQEDDDEDDDEDEDYEHDYDNSDGYYNEEEEESALYYECDGEAIVQRGDTRVTCPQAHVQVCYDQEVYSPKILVTDANTGEILADMLIYTDTEFQMTGDTCSWTGLDYTQNDAVEKTVTLNFGDSDTAMQFYDSCETSKASTYTSTDPEVIMFGPLIINVHFVEIGIFLIFFGNQVYSKFVYDLDGKDSSSEVEVRAVFINCKIDEKQIPYGSDTSRFQREELFRHNALRDCKKKLALTVKMSNDFSQSLNDEYIPIEHVFDGSNKKRVRLLNPYILRLRREPPFEAYKLRELETFNGLLINNDDLLQTRRDAAKNLQKRHVESISEEDWSESKQESIQIQMCPKLNTSDWQRNKRYDTDTERMSPFDDKNLPNWLKNSPSYGQYINSDNAPDSIKSQLQSIQTDDETSNTVVYARSDAAVHKTNPVLINDDIKSNQIQQKEIMLLKEKHPHKKQDEFDFITNKSDFIRPSNTEPDINNISENKKSESFVDGKEKEFVLYELANPDIWFRAQVQLLEKLSTSEGKTIWKDITQEETARITSSRPEWANQYVNIRYRSTEFVPTDDFTLPSTGICLLLDKDRSNTEDTNKEKFGEFIIVPFEDIEVIDGNSDLNERGENSSIGSASDSKRQHHRRIMVRLSRALLGRNGDGYKIVNEGSDMFLRLPYRQLHHAQIDLEAKADDNQLVYVGSSGRLTTAVSENTRRTRAALTIQVTNTGLAAARFRPKIRECGLETMRRINEDEAGTVNSIMIPPMHTHRFRIELPMDRMGDVTNCLVALVNDDDESVAVREVRIKRGDRCFCVWHCQCVCLNEDPKLVCQELAEYQQMAAGLSPRERPRQVRAACYPNVASVNFVVIFVGVIFLLLTLGLLKACLGLFFRCVGSWGIEQMLQTPRRLDHYYEHSLRDRAVVFDDDGWPVHPDTKKRTVRLISKYETMEFVLNVIFFITMPCLILWNSLKQITSHRKKGDDTSVDPKANENKYISSHDMQTKGALSHWRRQHRKRGLSRWMTSHAEELSTDIWRNGLAPQGFSHPECMRPLLHDERCRGKLYDLQTSLVDSEHDDTEYVLMQMQKSRESLTKTLQKDEPDVNN